MGLFNILSTLPSFGNLGEVALKHEWLCKIIGALIGFVKDVGIGIILFTLILKLLTLPLDIYSRASTKKNSLKLELMKDDLEKLKKQYKNNERLYQQKMMALYKKNGYSAFSACLPTLVTLIFFIIVIGAFNNYSRFADKEVFNQMGRAYDACLENYTEEGVLCREEGKNFYYLNYDVAIEEEGLNSYFNTIPTQNKHKEDNYELNFPAFSAEDSIIYTNDKYKSFQLYFVEGELNWENNGNLKSILNSCTYNHIIKVEFNLSEEEVKDFVKIDGAGYYIINLAAFDAQFDSAYIIEVDGAYVLNYTLINETSAIKANFEEESIKFIGSAFLNVIGNEYLNEVVRPAARAASAKAYEENKSSSVIFPWVKNLWVVDSPFKYALPLKADLTTSLGAENMGSLSQDAVYNELTYNLKAEYQQKGFGKGNGLFILVALSIITMLGSTLIMNKQQKTQMQLSSVDGENSQAASTQKMMTWMMPIMFGIFAFIYSAAFSIYMITSSLLSTGFTLLINLCVERAFKKQIEEVERQKAEKIKYGKRR